MEMNFQPRQATKSSLFAELIFYLHFFSLCVHFSFWLNSMLSRQRANVTITVRFSNKQNSSWTKAGLYKMKIKFKHAEKQGKQASHLSFRSSQHLHEKRLSEKNSFIWFLRLLNHFGWILFLVLALLRKGMREWNETTKVKISIISNLKCCFPFWSFILLHLDLEHATTVSSRTWSTVDTLNVMLNCRQPQSDFCLYCSPRDFLRWHKKLLEGSSRSAITSNTRRIKVWVGFLCLRVWKVEKLPPTANSCKLMERKISHDCSSQMFALFSVDV